MKDSETGKFRVRMDALSLSPAPAGRRTQGRRPLRAAGVTLGLVLAASLAGCASARMSDHEPDSLFRQARYDDAAEKLKKGLEKQGEGSRDELLYLLDLGLAYHSAGRYEESNRAFLKAEKIAEINDYTSLSAETATLLVSDNTKVYKGEDFEKVLINNYLAMNYALLGNSEDALVEARKVNRKLHLMVTEGKRKYKQSAFARYLSAILYEGEGNANDAYIDYKNAKDLDPKIPGIGRDLWRAAWMNGMRDDMERWDEEFNLSDEDHREAKLASAKSKKGEIIVIYENGISPVKKSHPNFRTIPKFFPRFNPVSYAEVEVQRLIDAPPAPRAAPAGTGAPSVAPVILGSAENAPGAAAAPTTSDGAKVAGPAPASVSEPVGEGWKKAGQTFVLDNIEKTAIENLDEKYAGIIAKKVGGIVAKEVVGDQIGKRTDPLVGALVKLAFYASDQADVRSWNLLPHDLQIARVVVEPGTYQVRAAPAGSSTLQPRTVQVKAGKKVFVNFRYMP